MAQTTTPYAVTALPVILVHQTLHRDEEAKAECLKLTGTMHPQKQDPPKPSTIEYSSKQIESARTHLEVFAKHSREYMVRNGEWEV